MVRDRITTNYSIRLLRVLKNYKVKKNYTANYKNRIVHLTLYIYKFIKTNYRLNTVKLTKEKLQFL